MKAINGATAKPATTYPPEPTCPKRCDVATRPEYAGGDRWVCVCCGTEFTWRGAGGPPS